MEGTDWAPTEPCTGCGHPYSMHVNGGCAYGEDHGDGATGCDCKLFMAADRPGEGHSIEATPSPQGVLLLGDGIEALRITFSTALSALANHDDPELLATRLAAAGVSPTGVAESCENAERNLRTLIDALGEG